MKGSKTLTMIALVVSGEAIFFLPFILPRVFRPTMLDVFQITNFELGTMFSAYGIVALISYFLGGPLADRFPARNLMTTALIATSFGGVLMATIPSTLILTTIYAFWGGTTILLFWAALIRATREWGGEGLQGRAFGLLDGGRGLAAALIGTAGVALLGSLLPEKVLTASPEEQADSFRWVILLFSVFTFLIAGFVWIVLPGSRIKKEANFKNDLSGIMTLLKKRTIWLQSVIIVCAYVGYKITDDFSLYAQDVLGMDEVASAGVGTFALWLRPVGAIAAGFLADRLLASRLIKWSFGLIFLSGCIIGFGILESTAIISYLITLFCMSIGVYALRALYYAIMEEADIPLVLTGTAVGIVSVVGYTPDIFVGPLMGWLLDRTPGAGGHEHLFLVLTIFAFIGWIAAYVFGRAVKRESSKAGEQ